MSANTKEPSRGRRIRANAPPTHKFGVGASVLYRTGLRLERAAFRVTRQLPDGGAGFQYRIKGEQDGLERVATESSLEQGD